jgi:hypothetical protein
MPISRAFFFQTLHTWRPGSLDTSFTSSDDDINNPRTMNAVYNLWPRLEAARRWGRETLGPDNLANKQFNDLINQGPLTQFFQPPNTVLTPHVLHDGADSVGALGALNRFYLDIGLFSEESLRHSNPILGGYPVTPIELDTARANSSYWQATETQTPNMAAFLVTASYPHKLKNAPGGDAYLSDRPDVVQQGKGIFADHCAACHSSKAPPQPAAANPATCIGAGYLDCWNRYWEWTQTSDFKQQMRQIVSANDFQDGNYLSNDMRVPVTLLQTNACSPLATNAIAGNIWDNFSSASYKDLPSVGAITVYDPFTGAPQQYQMPPGGRGYTRVPFIDQCLVDCAFPAQQHGRPLQPEPVGRSPDGLVRRRDHQAAVAGKAREGPDTRKQDPWRDRPHNRDELVAHSDRLSARRAQIHARSA